MVVRTPWSAFPPVAVHTDGATLRSHPAYLDASQGDSRAARRLVKEVMKPGKVSAAADYVVPLQQLNHKGDWNAIPMAFALHLAREINAKVAPLIRQENIVTHTAEDTAKRLINQPSFIGTVPRGRCIIVNDTVTYGSGLANLRGYLEHKGSQVLLASSLVAGVFATRLAPDPGLISSIKRRFPNELAIFPEKLGFPVDFLTNREGNYVYGLKNLESIRNPLAPTANFIRPSQ